MIHLSRRLEIEVNATTRSQYYRILLFGATVLALVCTNRMEGKEIGPLIATNAIVSVDPNGVHSIDIDLNARRVESSHVFFVAQGGSGDGAESDPFGELIDAFAAITQLGLDSATVYLSEGEFRWGDFIDPENGKYKDFNASLSIIGNGAKATRIVQNEAGTSAAVFNEPGHSLYVEGVAFVGHETSQEKDSCDLFDARNGVDLTFVDTVFQDTPNGDGLFVLGFNTVVVYQCAAINNYADGFSYTNSEGVMNVLEVEVEAVGNGINGLGSSQGSTMHRSTEIVRFKGRYANNPTNIEDTGLTSWNIDLTVENSTLRQSHERNNFVNLRVRGDKIDVTNGIAYLIGGSYNRGGIVHAHTTHALDSEHTPVYSTIRYTRHFDIEAYSEKNLFSDAGSTIEFAEDPDFPQTIKAVGSPD